MHNISQKIYHRIHLEKLSNGIFIVTYNILLLINLLVKDFLNYVHTC
jgi:hypothetical protein